MPPESPTPTIHLVVGSMLGTAEYLAEHLQSLLQQAGHGTELHLQPEWQTLSACTDQIWLVVTSTYGAGELPDNLQPLADDLHQQRPDLSALRYAVVAVGNSDYDTFCFAGRIIDQQLADLGGRSLLPRLEIDVLEYEVPEDAAEAWLPQLLTML